MRKLIIMKQFLEGLSKTAWARLHLTHSDRFCEETGGQHREVIMENTTAKTACRSIVTGTDS